MLKFVEREKRHQFIFGGSVWIIPKRISSKSRASVAIHEDPIVVVGRENEKSGIKKSFINIFRPFDKGTWALIVCFYLTTSLLHMLLAYLFARPRTLTNVCRHVLFDFSMSRNSERARLWNIFAVRVLVFVVSVSSVLIILFYEITVVNFVLRNSPRSLQKDLRTLTIPELKSYIVVKDDATELLFKSLVNLEGKALIPGGKPPWHQCDNIKDCYDKLRDPSHTAKFFFTFEHGLRHTMRSRKACDKLTIFETVSPLSSVSAGWYYGPSIPRYKQIAIDKAILDHRLQYKVQDLITKDKTSPICRTPAEVDKIPPEIIGWLLFFIAGPGFAVVAVAVFSAFRRGRPSRRARRKARKAERLQDRV